MAELDDKQRDERARDDLTVREGKRPEKPERQRPPAKKVDERHVKHGLDVAA